MEGPSLLILSEELAPFRGQKVLKVSGNTQQPKDVLQGRTLSAIDTWGKVLFLTFASPKKSLSPIVTKTHFLMFGSYRINDPRVERAPRLQLTFRKGIVYFYSCSIKFDAQDLLRRVDRKVDILSPSWNAGHVITLLRKEKKTPLCDLFLDQQLFAGSGNIIKNEVLFNIRRHPLEPLSRVPEKDWPKLAGAVRAYGWNFYQWKKKFELRKHWQVYNRGTCPLCGMKLKREHLGKFLRRTFHCSQHQMLHRRIAPLKVFPVLPVNGPTLKEPRLDH